MLHGKKAAQNSEQAAKEAFSGNLLGSNLPTIKIKAKNINQTITVLDLIILSKLEKSKSEIRRLIKGNAIKLNNLPINLKKKIAAHTVNNRGSASYLLRPTSQYYRNIMDNCENCENCENSVSLHEYEKELMRPNFYDISEFLGRKWDEIEDIDTLTKLGYIDEDELGEFNSRFKLNLDAYEIYSIGRKLDKDGRNNEFIDKLERDRNGYNVDGILAHILELYENGRRKFNMCNSRTQEGSVCAKKKEWYILNQIRNLKDGDIIFACNIDTTNRPPYYFFYVDRKSENEDLLKSTKEWFYYADHMLDDLEGYSNEEKLKINNGDIIEVLINDFKSWCLPQKFHKLNYYPAFITIMSWDNESMFGDLMYALKESGEYNEQIFNNDPTPDYIKF